MKKLLWVPPLIALLLWSVGCDEDESPPPPAATGLEILEVPGTMLANIDSLYDVRVRMLDEGVNAEVIVCTVHKPDGQVAGTFDLYDDGGDAVLPAHDFADTLSGDVVPNNGTYTRRINSRLLTDGAAGEYTFEFSVPNQSDPIYTDSRTVLAANIELCVFEDAPALPDLIECFEPFTLQVKVSKTEPDVVDTVRLNVMGMPPDMASIDLNPVSSDTLWEVTISPATFPCFSGPYNISYEAMTYFGLACHATAGGITIQSDDQSLSDFVGLPDTLYRPEIETDTFTVGVSVYLHDCNLLGIQTYNGVRFHVNKDNEGWVGDDSFVLNDSGAIGDTVAGDGTYSVGLQFWRSDEFLDNEYMFRYFSVECAPPYAQTDYIYDTVRVIQPAGPLIAAPSPNDPFGFSVLTATHSSPMGGSR